MDSDGESRYDTSEISTVELRPFAWVKGSCIIETVMLCPSSLSGKRLIKICRYQIAITIDGTEAVAREKE